MEQGFPTFCVSSGEAVLSAVNGDKK
jgi:hypothetical protein